MSDTNLGVGTVYDTPEEKEIERLNERLRVKDSLLTDQAHELYRLGLKLSGVEHERDTLTESLQRATELNETLKREAQIHAMEARTANTTIGELYQVLTGATGEPGNWNGAEPARKVMEQLAAAKREIDRLNATIASMIKRYPA